MIDETILAILCFSVGNSKSMTFLYQQSVIVAKQLIISELPNTETEYYLSTKYQTHQKFYFS